MNLTHDTNDPLHLPQAQQTMSSPALYTQLDLESLRQVFPSHSHGLLVKVLEQNQGDVALAIEDVLGNQVEGAGNYMEDASRSSDFEIIDLSDDGGKGKKPQYVNLVEEERKEEEKKKEVMVVEVEDKDVEMSMLASVESVMSTNTISNWSNNSMELTSSSHAGPSKLPSQSIVSSQSSSTLPREPLTIDDILAAVLGIFPDCCPAYVEELFTKHRGLSGQDELLNTVVGDIMETGGSYPKQTIVKKRKRNEENEEDEKVWEEKPDWDYEKNARVPGISESYFSACKNRLLKDFPLTPEAFIRLSMAQHHRLYTPTHAYLTKMYEDHRAGTKKLPFTPLLKARKANKKMIAEDEALLKELRFMHFNTAKQTEEKDKQMAEQMNEEEYEKEGALIECGCCFCEYTFDKMVQCDDGHLFCMDCARRNAEEQIGLRRTVLKCFDQSQCQYKFPTSEIKRFLPPKTFQCFVKIVQEEEIRNAGLEGFHSCPFCDFGAIVENQDDKEFHCGNPDCGARTCRKCNEESHLPLSCEEHAKDNKLSLQHKVEEAMTLALLRECPKCKRKFYKTEGCNKMTCSCGQLMCYVCRKAIKDYKHFNTLPGGAANPESKNGCPLFDDTEKRNVEDVVAAAKEAAAQVQKENPDLKLDDLEREVKKGVNEAKINPPPAPLEPPLNPAQRLAGLRVRNARLAAAVAANAAAHEFALEQRRLRLAEMAQFHAPALLGGNWQQILANPNPPHPPDPLAPNFLAGLVRPSIIGVVQPPHHVPPEPFAFGNDFLPLEPQLFAGQPLQNGERDVAASKRGNIAAIEEVIAPHLNAAQAPEAGPSRDHGIQRQLEGEEANNPIVIGSPVSGMSNAAAKALQLVVIPDDEEVLKKVKMRKGR